MENTTKEKVFYTSFRLFLENGYEATNIRDICKEVGVKASTVYFYYKSKQDLFCYIYDYICNDYIKYIKSIETLNQTIPIEDKLCILLKKKIKYCISDISKRKFILRCHLFPPEEISNVIREKYKSFTAQENKITIDIIGGLKNNDKFIEENINNYLLKYKNMENHLIYEMITSNIRINDEAIEKMWNVYFSLI